MMTIKKAALAAAMTTLFTASPLLANETMDTPETLSVPMFANETISCKHGNQERLIKLVYANESAAVPCEVTYDKGDGAGAVSTWQAQNLKGYCEEKMAAFVEKQRGWGWTCEKQM